MPKTVSLESSSTQSGSYSPRPAVKGMKLPTPRPIMTPIADRGNDANRRTPSMAQGGFRPPSSSY